MNFKLGSLAPVLAQAEIHLERERIVSRIWSRDHTVWADTDTEITDRLGWLDIHRRMAGRAAELAEWARVLVDEGFRQAVLIGMGGSSLAPEVFGELCRCSERGLELLILDTTDPEQIASLEERLDLAATLFVVATKSGGTVETLSGYQYFQARLTEQEGGRPRVNTSLRSRIPVVVWLTWPGRRGSAEFSRTIPTSVVGTPRCRCSGWCRWLWPEAMSAVCWPKPNPLPNWQSVRLPTMMRPGLGC